MISPKTQPRGQEAAELARKTAYAEGIFIDSGAFSLKNEHIFKRRGKRIGKNGRELAPMKPVWGKGDLSFFDLKAGTAFRAYCDSYAGFMRRMKDTGMLFVTVDVIGSPEMTWEVQRFFEEEHGLKPIPVIHYGCPEVFINRYVERGYDLLGISGPKANQTLIEYVRWADDLFRFLCPESNKFLPIVRTHGFAVTRWSILCRYPWWSVDSTSWVKASAYGWLLIPRWSETKGWRYDAPPMIINFSFRSPHQTKKDKHYITLSPTTKNTVERWLKELKMDFGTVTEDGEMDKEGVISHFRARAVCNLHYFKNLELSRPEWPHPLDQKVLNSNLQFGKGFGL